MPSFSIATILQVVVGLGLLNVWLVRARSATSYRGGQAKSLREEFAEYGLAGWVFYGVGALKVASGVALLAGLWFADVVRPAAGVVVLLMVGAIVMHLKVKDPAVKSVPAALMLLMSAGILGLY